MTWTTTVPDPSERSAWRLPQGYEFVGALSRRLDGAAVLRARKSGAEVVLRVGAEGESGERSAELAVLAAVAHPGVAKLLDWGGLEGGASFVAREWIEGVELGRWCAGRSEVEIGRVVAELCFVLAHLHQRGFVHADLKASNVLVRPDGQPVLTDFGLAALRGAAQKELSGSWLALAPERLGGAGPDAASDLFALGVMLAGLVAELSITPRAFYARFPTEDFFAAAGLATEALPEWARDLVVRLVARTPSERPPSAAWVGRAIAARLGLSLAAPKLAEAPRLALLTGREEVVRTIASARGDVWLECTAGEEVERIARELALSATLAGARVERLELASELASLRDSVSLDVWAQGRARRADDLLFVAAVQRDGAWEVRALEFFVRALRQRGAKARVLAVIAPGNVLPGADVGGLRLSLPPVSEEGWRDFVRAEFPDEDDERRAATAAWLTRVSGGSTTLAERALARAAEVGAITAGLDGFRVRVAALPNELGGVHAPLQVSREAQRFAAGFHVLGSPALAGDLARLAGIDDAAAVSAIDELVSQGGVKRRGAELEHAFDALQPLSALIEPSERRGFGERARAHLVRTGAQNERIVLFDWLAGRRTLAELLEELRQLRERGLHELALQLATPALALTESASERAALTFELALCWVGLGDLERAANVAEGLIADGSTSARAAALRAKAAIALHRHDAREALASATAARELDPSSAAAAGTLEVRALYELRRDAEVVERTRALLASPASESSRAALVEVQAMALARQGDVERAVLLLGEELADAERRGQRQRSAALALNLATLARRRGRPEEAQGAYERALAGYQASGYLPGVAQARAQWGAFLRERGELAASEPLLGSALELRERLGDRAGAVTVRGMLGLLFAERGHVRAALDELARAAEELLKGRKSVEAMLLDARAEECAARIGRRVTRSERPSDAQTLSEGDPRTLTALGRARWLLDDRKGAAESFERAERLARSVGLRAVAEEAQSLAARLGGRPLGAEITQAFANELVREDEELLGWLGAPELARPEVLARLDSLETRGRDDRAARLACALAARVGDPRRAATFRARFETLFTRCSAGLTHDEAKALRCSLSSIPDPYPEDLAAGERRSAGDEEFEMEVVSLLDINRQLLAQEELPRLLGTIVEKALEVAGAQRGFLILEEQGELSFDTARDSRRGDIRDPELEVSRSVLNEALAAMRAVRVSNASEEPDYAAAPSVIALDLRSILCVPFRVDAGLRGVIYVDHRLVESAFSPRAERMLSLLADQAGLAILQVRRLEEIRRLNRELRGQVANRDAELVSARRALARVDIASPQEGLVGSSAPMRAVHRMIERAAQVKLPVLVTGDSGTGKELAARALHSLSPRSAGPFISENCAALPPSLIESELFGTRRGAFTGADRDRDGLIERAHGGTLFLDEIGELPLELQAKLLRVLETSEVRRLGESTGRVVDFRLVAATNRNLELEVRENRFRADLYYRLDGLRVRMPLLSERESDIPELVEHFMRLQAAESGEQRAIAPVVLSRLARRAWPGNVRELFNELARLSVMSEGDLVDPELVRDPGLTKATAPRSHGLRVKSLADLEREAIFHALEVCAGDKRKAAELLGISRAKIYQRLKDWGFTGTAGDDAPAE
ncbi:MAG: sigma 54-interacting transcriptional regulator [Planctomycetes bacterium]|nr:sigma 54-interacting transcriptional regulator [Planctomycetota bacterium]